MFARLILSVLTSDVTNERERAPQSDPYETERQRVSSKVSWSFLAPLEDISHDPTRREKDPKKGF